MLSVIDQVSHHFLLPAELSREKLNGVLAVLLETGANYGDLYFQSVSSEHWVLEEGIVKEGSFGADLGVGIRAISGAKTGFAYSNTISLAALTAAAKAARGIVYHPQQNASPIKIEHQNILQIPPLYISDNPLHQLTNKEKINLLREMDALARSLDPRVKQVIVSLSGSYEMVYIANSMGLHAADIRPLVRLGLNVIVEDQGLHESAYDGGGGRFSYQYFLQDNLYKKYTENAVRQALQALTAQPAPAGEMPVVLGPGWPGVLLHEAIGHGLEGDFNRKGTSAFANCIGQRVGSVGVTIVDDGTLANLRGSLTVDDEGTPSQCTTLIEDGILRSYMHDTLNARLMNVHSTGNARRQSYAHIPIPRMTNTYMLAGAYDSQEIIESVKKGIFAVNFGGGQVDITSGKFVFSASEAYLIENGRVTVPIKGATLAGHGPDILTKVVMVGNDLKLDPGIGTCGKDGQGVPVGVGQPTLKVAQMTVGGAI